MAKQKAPGGKDYVLTVIDPSSAIKMSGAWISILFIDEGKIDGYYRCRVKPHC